MNKTIIKTISAILALSIISINTTSAFTYSSNKYINDKTKISIDNAIKNLNDSKLKLIQGKVDNLLNKKLSKKNSELLNYLSYSIKTKLILSKKIESEKQKQVSIIDVKTNTGIVVNSVPKNTSTNITNVSTGTTNTAVTTTTTTVINNSTNVSRNNSANQSTIGKYPTIKTVEELKKYVKEFNAGNNFDSDLNPFIYVSLGNNGTAGWGRIDNPNNIDWTKGWDSVIHQDLSENALLKYGDIYFYTLGGYTKKIEKGGLSDEDYANTKKELENLVGTLIEGKTNDEDKIKAIFDRTTQNIKYRFNYSGSDLSWNTPVLVYKNKDRICSGYTQLMYFMLKKAGISDVHVVFATLLGIPHALNKIGNYYYDATNTIYKFTDLSKYGIIETFTAPDM
ncbi:MAG: hypothetical protein PHR68_04805 [Candidatus Gracilibacteria bacterium]|nr:hypothetical protein [Candidatus Gracilibacteria bacterium]